jgi:hypothetical protein
MFNNLSISTNIIRTVQKRLNQSKLKVFATYVATWFVQCSIENVSKYYLFMTSSNKIFKYMKLKNRFTKDGEKAVNSSVNVGWLQLISLQVYNCFNNAHNFFKLLPTRFYNCPLLPPIINNLAGELPPT